MLLRLITNLIDCCQCRYVNHCCAWLSLCKLSKWASQGVASVSSCVAVN